MRTYQCHRTVVCSCGKHHRPGGNAGEGRNGREKGRKCGTFANRFLFEFFMGCLPPPPGGWLDMEAEVLREATGPFMGVDQAPYPAAHRDGATGY